MSRLRTITIAKRFDTLDTDTQRVLAAAIETYGHDLVTTERDQERAEERSRCVGVIEAAIAGYKSRAQESTMDVVLQSEMKMKISALEYVASILRDVS